VVYLVIAAIAGSVFVFCSYWVYHFVDPEHDNDRPAEFKAMDPVRARVGAETLPSSQGSDCTTRRITIPSAPSSFVDEALA
jgi:hypothetical protein